MTLMEQLFVCEYIRDWNGTAAIQRVPGYVGKWPSQDAWLLLRKPEIAKEIDRCRAQLVGTVQLSIKMVVQDIVDVLEADPRDLIDVITIACRHCHGEGHRFHRTIIEYEADLAKLQENFDHLGGIGFNPYREPHPDCPNCFGCGEVQERLKDVRNMTKGQAALYLGAERTKHGIRINMRSKDAARQQAALYLGMNKETLKVQKTKAAEMTDDELAAIVKGETDDQ